MTLFRNTAALIRPPRSVWWVALLTLAVVVCCLWPLGVAEAQSAPSIFTWEGIKYHFALALHAILTTVPGIFVWLTGILLNVAVQEFIIEMGTWIRGDSGIGFTVNTMWAFMREANGAPRRALRHARRCHGRSTPWRHARV